MSTYQFDHGPDSALLQQSNQIDLYIESALLQADSEPLAQASNQIDLYIDSALLQADSERTNTSELSGSSTKTWRLQLEADFQPSKYSVICGRGKASYDHAGNHRLRNLASMFVEKYSLTDCKQYKSTIASHIVARTREMGGEFCKYEQGAWFEVGDHFARGKVSAMFRDMLHTQYRSSSMAKTTRRSVETKRKKITKPNSTVGSTPAEPDTGKILPLHRRRNVRIAARTPWGSITRWISTSSILMSFRIDGLHARTHTHNDTP
jgi:hypothetical protein